MVALCDGFVGWLARVLVGCVVCWFGWEVGSGDGCWGVGVSLCYVRCWVGDWLGRVFRDLKK